MPKFFKHLLISPPFNVGGNEQVFEKLKGKYKWKYNALTDNFLVFSNSLILEKIHAMEGIFYVIDEKSRHSSVSN